ncbi:hypothetical protein BUE93_07775 [Chromobacterium amazonense]|uniref:ATP-dependent DNA ligase family profile domain-containing protein n=1 Tax=Chromobacterium amazonense TaxID=1382803 RepID=A0A2S9X6A4_9NEIS|nr:hypothetical protein [Chromobacterium amazonense]PRP71259.1 hypothetical protein BUE93_07775 [Chromobacterium amazonense]
MRYLVSPQRCLSFNEKQIQKAINRDGYVLVDSKIDGVRCLVFREAGSMQVISRAGIPIVSLPQFAEEAFKGVYIPEGHVVEAEFKIYGMPFEEMSGIVRRHEELDKAHWDMSYFHPFACVPMKVLQMSDEPDAKIKSIDARNIARVLIGKKLPQPLSFKAFSLEDVEKFYSLYLDNGFEGAVIKEVGGYYQNGKKVGWWRKKPSEPADGKIIGCTEGNGKYKGTLGTLTVELEDGTICHPGTGFDDDLRNEIWNNFESYRGRYVQVSYMERTKLGKLRHPVFEGFRDLDYSKGDKL